MKRIAKKTATTSMIPNGRVKAILRGGTFHRVQILLDPTSNYIEHCGLSYRVTQQKDSDGRVICLWAKN